MNSSPLPLGNRNYINQMDPEPLLGKTPHDQEGLDETLTGSDAPQTSPILLGLGRSIAIGAFPHILLNPLNLFITLNRPRGSKIRF